MHRTLAPIAALLVLGAPLTAQQPAPTAAPDSTIHVKWQQVALAVGGLAVVSTIDVTIANAFQDNRSPGSLNTARQLDRFGDLTGAVPILGGLAIISLVSHNHRLGKATLRAAASAALAAAVTQGVKRIVGRERPIEDSLSAYDFHFFTNHQAFPSGHTAAAFALATSLGDGIGRTWARVGLFTLAAGTAWARMEEHEHWFSDVLAGAAVGVVSSKWASGRLRVFGLRAPKFLIGPGSIGISVPMPHAGS